MLLDLLYRADWWGGVAAERVASMKRVPYVLSEARVTKVASSTRILLVRVAGRVMKTSSKSRPTSFKCQARSLTVKVMAQ